MPLTDGETEDSDDRFDYTASAEGIDITLEPGFWERSDTDIIFDCRVERLILHVKRAVYILAGRNGTRH